MTYIRLADDQLLSVAATPSISRRMLEGKVFLEGTGRRSLALAGNFRATMQNPVGSGRILLVARLTAFSTATGWARLFIDPTTGQPTNEPRPTVNALLTHPNVAVAMLRADTSATTALSGGIDTGIDLAAGAGDRVEVDLPPVLIPPGTTLGVNIPFAGAADASLNVVWFEEDAA